MCQQVEHKQLIQNVAGRKTRKWPRFRQRWEKYQEIFWHMIQPWKGIWRWLPKMSCKIQQRKWRLFTVFNKWNWWYRYGEKKKKYEHPRIYWHSQVGVQPYAKCALNEWDQFDVFHKWTLWHITNNDSSMFEVT